MVFDYSKLRGRIIEKFGTIERFAKELDLSYSSVSKKLCNKVVFTQAEILSIAKLLNIDTEAIPQYFFVLVVK